MRSRCSTSRSIRTPPSDDNKPPSNVATTDLPETGDRPGNGSVELIMADVVSQKCCGFESITRILRPIESLRDIWILAANYNGEGFLECVSSRSAAANSMKISCSMRGWIGILFNPQHAHSHSET